MKTQRAVWNGEDAILEIAKQKKDREDGHGRRLDGKGMGTEDNED